ncbi:hypothetical protein SAMN05216577_111106 [Pseudomonas citronellolis]|uniref:Uncharacterized protein n=1 Tax=Pseudomonas citronellolis TaxID=53408 RepID=A0AAQ1HMM9_9PSED|nr:hypothetical protein [Pseudomonas citronellolis]TGC30833.1 hypothetical protein CW310_07310 [Pseudomonas citronellolis]SFC84719.1 hypothetical protein SAMN05216577_111106 [Pseudomonas citronellolis]
MDYFETKATLRFTYTDSYGNVSGRIVDVELVEDGMITGKCRMKNARRTFRIDRITNCWDDSTNRHVPDVLQHLRDAYAKSTAPVLDKLYAEHLDELKVLLYVGKADGQLRAPELRVITAACKVITKDTRLTDEDTRELLESIPVPTLQGFKVAVGKIAKENDSAAIRRITIATRTIVDTQQNISPGEQEALNYIAKRLQPKG